MDHVELFLVMLKAEIDVVDFTPTRPNVRKMSTLVIAPISHLQFGGRSLEVEWIRVKTGAVMAMTHTTCIGTRSTATQEQ